MIQLFFESSRAGGCAGFNYPFLTLKERDTEAGLDYFIARYYSSTQGRFTSRDEFSGGPEELFDFSAEAADNPTFYADLTQPQSLNKYQYCLNSPLVYLDPNGHQQALTNRILLDQGYFGRLSASLGAAYDRVVVAGGNAAAKVAGFRAKVQKYVGTDRDSLIESSMRGPFALPRGQAELVADQSIAFNDGLMIGPTRGITALDTMRLVALAKTGAQALEGLSGRLVVSKTAYSELVAGSTVEKVNALLQKFGIEKFFGVKNGAAFEKALQTGLNAGLTANDARILATAKAQGTALATRDGAIIEVAKRIGVAIK